MENRPTSKRRFQFSLGTLLMGVIAVGACMGMFFLSRENTTLRSENRALRKEIGYLNIDDPNKAWVRAVKRDEGFKWRFRVYLPRAACYRIGIQTNFEVEPAAFNRKLAGYCDLFFINAGEVQIDAQIVKQPDGRASLMLYTPECNATGVGNRYTTSINWTKSGFDTLGYNSIGPPFCLVDENSRSFDMNSPLILLAVKSMKQSASKSASVSSVTNDPGPGLMIWLEEAPPKQ